MKRDIAKLVAEGLYREAIHTHSQRHSLSFLPNSFTFPPLFKACIGLNLLPQGQIFHTHLMKSGLLSNIHSSTSLLDMYMKLNAVGDAVRVFEETPNRNLPMLNAAITGFSQNGCWEKAFWVFREIGGEGFRPNSVSIASVLIGCGNVKHGVIMHCWAVKLGVSSDVYVTTSLVTMYLNCREMVSAKMMFESTSNKSVVSCNAFLSGLLQNDDPCSVVGVFKNMRGSIVEKPNSVTLALVLSACSIFRCVIFGRQIHGLAKKLNLDFYSIVGTALVDMYSKCGFWQWALAIFSEMNGSRNLITWNSILAGMMLNDQSEKAVELFSDLVSEGLKPDSVTWNSMISGFSRLGRHLDAFGFFNLMQALGIMPSLNSITSLLGTCSDISSLQQGKQIHGNAIRKNYCEDEFMVTALIDMYMKCGCTSLAQRGFDQFATKSDDPAMWNAMIFGYGRNGEYEPALKIFDKMLLEKVKPNSATFTGILSACSHTGHVNKGWEIFRMINTDYGLNPTTENYGCMVDLLARSGHLEEAEELLSQMPHLSTSVFDSMLGACKTHINSELGEEMALKLSELEPENSSPFVILSNIYAAQGRWKDAERIRGMMDNRHLTKPPGYSIIAVTGMRNTQTLQQETRPEDEEKDELHTSLW